MPVQPMHKEPEEMEMEADSAAEVNGEEEDTEEEQSGSQSESEEESSEMDDEDCERRRIECLDEMSDLEKQFTDLKEKLFKERLSQVKAKLEEVIEGKAAEYLEPLAVLQNNMKIRTEVAGVYRELCLEVIGNRYECEMQGAKQHLESEKLLLYDNMYSELVERIQRLEDGRQNFNFSTEWWNDDIHSKKKKKWELSKSEKKKKPTLVSGPYIVYMLRDIDILEDWSTIKKILEGENMTGNVNIVRDPLRRNSISVVDSPQRRSTSESKAVVSPQKRKSDTRTKSADGLVKTEKHLYSAKCEDGRLYYEGESFIKGQNIILQVKDEMPSQATITAVSTAEVWLRREDGSKTKLYVSQLQKGKYTIRKV